MIRNIIIAWGFKKTLSFWYFFCITLIRSYKKKHLKEKWLKTIKMSLKRRFSLVISFYLVVKLFPCVNIGSPTGSWTSPRVQIILGGGWDPVTWHRTSYSVSAMIGSGRLDTEISRIGISIMIVTLDLDVKQWKIWMDVKKLKILKHI